MTGPLTGLAPDEVLLRQQRDGPNALPVVTSHGLWTTLREVAGEPMILLLLAAGAVYLVLGAAGDALLLLGFVVMVIVITVVQSRRTEHALDALRDLSSPTALVIRLGQRLRIPARDLVRGDLMALTEGDRIPADGVLRVADGITVDESLLTGESLPVEKTAAPDQTQALRPDAGDPPSVYAGTLMVTGNGVAEVVAIGSQAEIGRIGAALAAVVATPTGLQRETGRLVRRLALVGLGLCAVMAVIYALSRGGDAAAWTQGLLAGIAMAMAVMPEELPMLLTVFFALGAWRIARHRVLTRHLPTIENLGAISVLCTDKTGTLTMNRMAVERAVFGGRTCRRADAEGLAPAGDLLAVAALASRPEAVDPMDRALLAAVAERPRRTEPGRLVRTWPLVRPLLATAQGWQAADGAIIQVAAKGAPEAIATLCRLTGEERQRMEAQVQVMATDGLRVLAVGRGSVAGALTGAALADLPLAYVGLVAFADPLRPNVPAAVAECQTAGIRVVMITGDHPQTALAIAAQAGIAHDGTVLTGAIMERLSDADLAQRLRTVPVCARITPEAKLRIVRALQAGGDVVAMTGDGVNDAPALKAADVGIAMGGRGTDVAREAADLVLLDDDFTAIVTAIRLGRRVYDNLRKGVVFTCAVHVPIAGLSLLPIFNVHWPLLLLPVHIMFLEMVIDPSCSLVFEAEPGAPDLMRRPARKAGENLYSLPLLYAGLIQGGSALAVCLGVFAYAHGSHPEPVVRALVFTTLVAAIMTMIVANRSWSLNLWQVLRTPNLPQVWVLTGTAAVLAATLGIPGVQGFFRFGPLHLDDLAIALVGGVGCIAWFELIKGWSRRNLRPASYPRPLHDSDRVGPAGR